MHHIVQLWAGHPACAILLVVFYSTLRTMYYICAAVGWPSSLCHPACSILFTFTYNVSHLRSCGLAIPAQRIGNFDTELVEHFFSVGVVCNLFYAVCSICWVCRFVCMRVSVCMHACMHACIHQLYRLAQWLYELLWWESGCCPFVEILKCATKSTSSPFLVLSVFGIRLSFQCNHLLNCLKERFWGFGYPKRSWNGYLNSSDSQHQIPSLFLK